MEAGFEKVYELVQKARLAVPVDTKALDNIRDKYGYDLYKEALGAVLENHSLGWFLAERLNDFYKEYDFYDYMDKMNGTEEDVVAELARQLEEPEAVSGILDALAAIRENGRLDAAQGAVLDELVLDLAEVQVKLGKSVSDVIAEAVERSENIQSDKMTIDILQVKQGDEYRFWRFASLSWSDVNLQDIEVKNYNHIYQMTSENPVDFANEDAVVDLLERVYARFNGRQPEDFKGHSLSVSDVLVVSKGNERKAFYCDSIGFEELPEKFLKDFSVGLIKDDSTRDI